MVVKELGVPHNHQHTKFQQQLPASNPHSPGPPHSAHTTGSESDTTLLPPLIPFGVHDRLLLLRSEDKRPVLGLVWLEVDGCDHLEVAHLII